MAATKDDYNDYLTEAAHTVLLELARLLKEYSDGIVVVGGLVPGLLVDNPQQPHVGSIDVDIAVNHNLLKETGYRSIMQLLTERGYIQGEQPFIFYRAVHLGNQDIKVEVDFLAGEYGGTGKTRRTQTVQDMHPRKARACDLAFLNPVDITLEGTLPGGGKDQATIRVASIASFLMMKAQALTGRLKEKDAYDIFYCLVNYRGGLDALIEEFRPILKNGLVNEGLKILAEKFQSPDHSGPVFVADFQEETDPDSRASIQRDAFERVNYILHKLGIN